MATKSWSSPRKTPAILLFGNPSSPSDQTQSHDPLQDFDGGLKKAKVAQSRPVSRNHEHVIAERKRREQIADKLNALSTIIPGIKKRDKASILEDAIIYMKQMEQKVKTLEDQTAKRRVESVDAVKISRLSAAGDESSEGRAEVQARISGKTVLITIRCQDRKGMLVKALTEVENHCVSVINASSLPLPNNHLDITVTAQVEEGFSMSVKDLLKKLNSAFRKFM